MAPCRNENFTVPSFTGVDELTVACIVTFCAAAEKDAPTSAP